MSKIIEINYRKQKLKISSNTKNLKIAKLKISKNLFINYLISDFKQKIKIGISIQIYEFLFLPAWQSTAGILDPNHPGICRIVWNDKTGWASNDPEYELQNKEHVRFSMSN